jgi:hypothetical protein
MNGEGASTAGAPNGNHRRAQYDGEEDIGQRFHD